MNRFEAKSQRLVNKKKEYEYKGRIVINTMSPALLSNSKLVGFLTKVDEMFTKLVNEVKQIKFNRNPMVDRPEDIIQ